MCHQVAGDVVCPDFLGPRMQCPCYGLRNFVVASATFLSRRRSTSVNEVSSLKTSDVGSSADATGATDSDGGGSAVPRGRRFVCQPGPNRRNRRPDRPIRWGWRDVRSGRRGVGLRVWILETQLVDRCLQHAQRAFQRVEFLLGGRRVFWLNTWSFLPCAPAPGCDGLLRLEPIERSVHLVQVVSKRVVRRWGRFRTTCAHSQRQLERLVPVASGTPRRLRVQRESTRGGILGRHDRHRAGDRRDSCRRPPARPPSSSCS